MDKKSNRRPPVAALSTHTAYPSLGGPLPVTPRLVERVAPRRPPVRWPLATFPLWRLWGATPQTPTVRASSDPAWLGWSGTSIRCLAHFSVRVQLASQSVSSSLLGPCLGRFPALVRLTFGVRFDLGALMLC